MGADNEGSKETINGATEKPKKRRRKRSIGAHGEDALELFFRIGGATGDQYQRFSGLKRTIARDTLARLEENKYVHTTNDFARYKEREELEGRKPDGTVPLFYYLTAKGVDYGAQLSDAEDIREAREAYKRHGYPGMAAHSSLENRVMLAAIEAADKDDEWHLMAEDVVCESSLDYPLETGEKKEKKSKQMRLLYPDGEMAAGTPHGDCIYMLEVESGVRRNTLRNKIRDYSSWMMRAELIRPLIFVGLTGGKAASMRKVVSEALSGVEKNEYRKWVELWRRKARGQGDTSALTPGHIIGFAGVGGIEEAFSREGIEAPAFEMLEAADDEGSPLYLSLSDMAALAADARGMLYGVREMR